MNRYCGHTSKTFIVEDCIEDEFGQWATDELTGAQGYVDDEGSCFLDMGQQRVCLAIQTIQEPKIEKHKGKGKNKGGSTGNGRAFLGEEQAQESELWSEEACAWWSEGKRGNVMKAYGRVEFALIHYKKVQAVISTRTKAGARIKKERAMKVLILNQDLQPLKHPVKKDVAILGNQTISILA